MKEAQDKLAAAAEASKRAAEEAKKKAREIKTAVGLARTIGPQVPSFVTHRGMGAFCSDDFVKVATQTSSGIQSEKNKATEDQRVYQEDKSTGCVGGNQSEILPANLNGTDGRLDKEMKTGIEVKGTN